MLQFHSECLFNVSPPPTGRREASEQLLHTQSSLSRQEEAWHQAQQEKRSLGEELTKLRAGLHRAEAETRALQVWYTVHTYISERNTPVCGSVCLVVGLTWPS